MISSFKNYLIEEEKTVFFTFGRMNPPTVGHEKLMNELSKKSGKTEIILPAKEMSLKSTSISACFTNDLMIGKNEYVAKAGASSVIV